MEEIKWIKINTDMFNDDKIKLIESLPEADSILIVWIKLLAQAGKTNACGHIFLNPNFPYNEEMLATLFNRKLTTVRMALKVLKDFGMIEIDENEFINITNWTKHQNIEGMEKIREQNRLRKQRERDKKNQVALGHSNQSRDSHATVTPNHAIERELEREREKERERERAEKADRENAAAANLNNFGQVIQSIERNLTMFIGAKEQQMAKFWLAENKDNVPLILYAIERTKAKEKKTHFVDYLLKTWSREGITDPEVAKAFEEANDPANGGGKNAAPDYTKFVDQPADRPAENKYSKYV